MDPPTRLRRNGADPSSPVISCFSFLSLSRTSNRLRKRADLLAGARSKSTIEGPPFACSSWSHPRYTEINSRLTDAETPSMSWRFARDAGDTGRDFELLLWIGRLRFTHQKGTMQIPR